MSTSYVCSLNPCLIKWVASFYGVIESPSDCPASIMKLFYCGELSSREFCAALAAVFTLLVDWAIASCLFF